MFVNSLIIKKEKLDMIYAQRGWTVEGRAGGKNVENDRGGRSRTKMLGDLRKTQTGRN